MGVRKNRADMGTYERYFVGRQSAPRGMRWTKPSVIITALELAIVRDRALSCQALLDFARKTISQTGAKWGRNAKGFANGDKGNILLEYAWAKWAKGVVVGEQDIMVAVRNGDVNRWYQGLCKGVAGKRQKPAETVILVGNAKRLRRQRKKAAKVGRPMSEAEKAKALGDKIRAEAAAAKATREANTTKLMAEQAVMERIQAAIKNQ